MPLGHLSHHRLLTPSRDLHNVVQPFDKCPCLESRIRRGTFASLAGCRPPTGYRDNRSDARGNAQAAVRSPWR